MNRFIFSVVTFFCGVLGGFSQKIHPDYLDGKLYVRLTSFVHPKTGEAILPGKNFSTTNLPFELENPGKYGIRSVKRAFPINASPELNSTLEIVFDNHQLAGELIEEINQSRFVKFAERVPLIKKDLVPNDPQYPSLWHLAKINAATAWNYFSTGSNVVIAVVDDALDRNHPDISPNLWVNAGEIANNGIDDDGNGFVDDRNGWDVGSNSGDIDPPSNQFNHGTHVAGIASGATNNGVGISSIGFSCKLMGVTSRGDDPDALPNPYAGVLYAATAGANIINMSWGGSGSSQTAQSVIEFAISKGCILVGSAGNENTTTERYPAAFNDVISVASTTANDTKSSFSNYGSWVKISAPGSAILSTEPFSDYGFQSGTSMATPLVAGLLGLMKSLNPGMPNPALINCLYSSAENIDPLNPGYETWLGAGRINAANAMACVSASLNNPPVADFTASTRVIQAGNTINFTDQSTYNPTTWSWSFAGGTPNTSNVKNPNNILYSTPGTYAVTLTVSNANGQDVETKTDYITVTEPSACFTVNLPVPGWSSTVYTFQDENGFLNGTNIYNDKQKAMYFDVSNTQNTTLARILIGFSHANSTDPANLSKIITIRVFDGSSGNDFQPGTQITSATRTIAQIRQDILAQRYTSIDFLQNIALPASKKFYVSVDISNLVWNATTKDSLAIFSNNYQSQGDGSNDLWELWEDDSWSRYSASYGVSGMKLFIHPHLTSTPTAVVINPKNPAICSGGKVDFTASASTLQNGQPFQWQFEGTTPSVVNNSSNHTAFYNNAGSFKAYLIALGVCNELRIDSTVVTVAATPSLNVTASKNPICQGETATLTVSGAGSYAWSPATGLSATQGSSVQANPTTTTSYTITGTSGTCTGTTVYELEVRALTTSVNITANPANITQPTSVTFTATATNGGSDPTYNFKVNGQSVQSGSGNTLVRQVNVGDKVICEFTTSEPCVSQKTVYSNELTMGEPDLPIYLSRFTGRKLSNANLLEWTTVTEINSQEFVVERGNDGIQFSAIGKVAASGNSNNMRDYQLQDPKYEAGKNFYRLKMVDLDGSFRYSRIVLIDNSAANLITTLSPNPARPGAESLLRLNGLPSGKVGISVISATGATVREYELNSTDGNLQVRLPVQNLGSGIYLLVVKNADGTIAETLKWSVIR